MFQPISIAPGVDNPCWYICIKCRALQTLFYSALLPLIEASHHSQYPESVVQYNFISMVAGRFTQISMLVRSHVYLRLNTPRCIYC
jgi:hypothetical protein